jgi:hypothetical protein
VGIGFFFRNNCVVADEEVVHAREKAPAVFGQEVAVPVAVISVAGADDSASATPIEAFCVAMFLETTVSVSHSPTVLARQPFSVTEGIQPRDYT